MQKYKILYVFLFIMALSGHSSMFAQQIQPLSAEQEDNIEEYEELVDIYRGQDDLKQAVSYLNRIAFIYWENGHLNKAVENFLMAISLNEDINDRNSMVDNKIIYSNLGLIYADMEDLETALQYFNRSLSIRRELGDRKEIAAGLIDVAYILRLLGDYESANDNLEEALQISLEGDHSQLILSCYNELSKNYDHIGNVKAAEEHRNKYQTYQQILDEQAQREEFQEREAQNVAEIRKTKAEVEAQQLAAEVEQLRAQRRQDSLSEVVEAREDSLARERELAQLREERIEYLDAQAKMQQLEQENLERRQQQQQLIIYAGSAVLFLILILSVILIRNNIIRKKTNKELASKNKEIEEKSDQLQDAFEQIEDQNIKITKSINYAQGIQKALLPQQTLLNDYIPNSFIFFRPRDIVSGDFYWFNEIDARVDLFETRGEYNARRQEDKIKEDEFITIKNNKFAISAVDCTGHGVPGAFMSMIGYNLLDEIIGSGISRADIILNELHKGVRKSLKQDLTENRDGMDLALCVINKIDRTVHYSGASNPLIYVKEGEIHHIRADRNAIGGVQTEDKRRFTGHTIKVDSPTWFYLFSDGYPDQFGGKRGKKFMLKNLKNLLFEIHTKSPEEQNEILGKKLDEWQGDSFKQVDDVLVIGFQLGGTPYTRKDEKKEKKTKVTEEEEETIQAEKHEKQKITTEA